MFRLKIVFENEIFARCQCLWQLLLCWKSVQMMSCFWGNFPFFCTAEYYLISPISVLVVCFRFWAPVIVARFDRRNRLWFLSRSRRLFEARRSFDKQTEREVQKRKKRWVVVMELPVIFALILRHIAKFVSRRLTCLRWPLKVSGKFFSAKSLFDFEFRCILWDGIVMENV